jgi:hypothetical protein
MKNHMQAANQAHALFTHNAADGILLQRKTTAPHIY